MVLKLVAPGSIRELWTRKAQFRGGSPYVDIGALTRRKKHSNNYLIDAEIGRAHV